MSQIAADTACFHRHTAMLARAWWAPLVLVAASGASCPQVVDQYKVPVARALPEQPTLESVLTVLNQNSSRVQELYTTRATVSAPGIPTLKANLAYQRDRRFRLFAETALTGTAVDLGSNDELFWFSAAEANPPALYFCRHDEFATSPARQALSVEPSWLIEALGVVYFDPRDDHYGPIDRGNGTLEIHTEATAPGQDWKRITIVDAERGWIREQHAYDGSGKLVASAVARQHQRDPLSEATLPRQVEVHWPAMNLRLTIELEELAINELPPNLTDLWELPQYSGWQVVNLGQMQAPLAPPGSPAGEMPADLNPGQTPGGPRTARGTHPLFPR